MNDVSFKIISGMNRKKANQDHVSALILPIPLTTPAPQSGYKLASANDFLLTPFAANAVVKYQVGEFFRIAGEGAELWIFAANRFQDSDFVNLTGGRVRQIAVQLDADLAAIAVQVAAYQALATRLDSVFRTPCHIIIAPKSAATDMIANPPDLRTLNAPCVSVLISGDGGNRGLAVSPDFVPALGAVLGLLSARKVSESVAWVQACRVDDGAEYQVIQIADVQNLDRKPLSVQDTLDQKGYLCLRKFANFDGTYLNDSHVCNGATQDLAYIEANRTLQKAKRALRQVLLPHKNSPVTMDKKGNIAIGYLNHIQSIAEKPISDMRNGGELSDFQITISAGQSVVATGELEIGIQLLPIATLRKPVVAIGFTSTINNL